MKEHLVLGITLMLQLFNVAAIGADIAVRATCADAMTMYTDASDTPIATHNNKATKKCFKIPATTKVVSIKCVVDKTKSANAGILASFNMETTGDYVTDATWRCNQNYVADWTKSSFDDSIWPYAVVNGNNDNTQAAGLSKVSGIAAHSKWIWNNNYLTQYGDLTVFCRGRIGIEPSMDNYGRWFAIGFMENVLFSGDLGNVRDLQLLITTLKPTDITVLIRTPKLATSNNLYIDHVLTVKAGEIGRFELPKKDKESLRHETDGVKDTKSILVMATDAIKIVGENQDRHSTDLFLCLPLNAIGTANEQVEYYAICWDAGNSCRMLLVAGYDSTNVTVTTKSALTYNGQSMAAGLTFTFTLNKYDSIQFGNDDMSGTYISSTNPLSAYSGNRKAAVKYGGSADHMVEQLLPSKTWGKEFVITPLAYGGDSRAASDVMAVYQIISAVDGTQVTIKRYIESTGAVVKSDVITLNKGKLLTLDDLNKDHLAVVTSTEGITIAQFSTTKSGGCKGDPWMQVMPPTYEFERDYSMLTPKLEDDAGACPAKHYATVLIDDSEKSGITITTSGITSDIDVTKYHNVPGTNFVEQTIEVAYGEHRIKHKKTSVSFGLYFYGYGYADSYAIMGGVRLSPINKPCATSKSKLGDGIDNNCNGKIDEEVCTQDDPDKDCAPPSPVNGNWSTWGIKGICQCSSVSIDGTIKEVRSCNNPLPRYNGLPCLASDLSSRQTKTCKCEPINGGWSTYGAWGQCSKTCGPGKETKNRVCNNPIPAYGGNDCAGSSTQDRDCFVTHCPINGNWGAWSASGSCNCSAQVGHGVQTYKRQCDNPAAQYGGNACATTQNGDTKTDTCDCDIDGEWSAWGSFGSCSVTCGPGTWARSRTCTNPPQANNGIDCLGSPTETASCQASVANCPIHGGWGDWVSGTVCNCSLDAYNGTKTQTRQCNNPTPQYNGDNCVGRAQQEIFCDCLKEAAVGTKFAANVIYKSECSEAPSSKDNSDLPTCLQKCAIDAGCITVVYKQHEVKPCSLMASCTEVASPFDSVVFIKKADLTTTTTKAPLGDNNLDPNTAGAQGADPNAAGAQAQGGEDDSSTIKAAAIAGGVAGAAIAAIAIIIIARRRKKKKEEEEPKPQSEANDMNIEEMGDTEW